MQSEDFVAQYGGYEYLVRLMDTSEDAPLLLTAHPLALPEGDTRSISVMQTVDTETGEESHSVVMPENIPEEEGDMWTSCLSVVVIFMAQISGTTEE